MDRIQPPPNYYGAPYPSSQETMGNTPYPPQMGGYPQPPNQNIMPPYPPQPMTRQEQDNSIEEFYESLNKLVSDNVGRLVNVHCSFTDSTKWHDKEFIGVLASSGDNYVIVYDKDNNKHYLIIGVYIDYIEFFENITMNGVTSK